MQNIVIEKIEPNDYNPNVMTDAEFAECKNEIQHLGTIPKPIIVRPVDGKFVIVDGEHNWRAAKDLGFESLPCEIIPMDFLEAMRQTYKRNMHGTFNPSKLGKMFECAIKESGFSQRDLAKQYEVSEGTIRNALMYCEAYRLRNNYAFDKLTIRQVRLYLALPQGLRDKWLDAGADSQLLINNKDLKQWEIMSGKLINESTFDDMEAHAQKYDGSGASFLNLYKGLDKFQLWDLVKPTRQEFKQSIEKLNVFTGWAYWQLCGQRMELWEQVKPYALLIFNYFDYKDAFGEYEYRKEFVKCFRLIRYKGEFRITVEEMAKIFNDSFVVGCDHGYRWQLAKFQYIRDSLQALLIKKGVVDSPVDINIVPDPSEVIMAARINKEAPDYIKQATIPAIEKAIILDYVQDNPFLSSKPEDVEAAKRQVIKLLEQRHQGNKHYKPEQSEIRSLIFSCIHDVVDQRKIDNMDDQTLAKSIVQKTSLYTTEDSQILLANFVGNLQKLNRNELVAIYQVMDYSDYIKRMRQNLKALGK